MIRTDEAADPVRKVELSVSREALALQNENHPPGLVFAPTLSWPNWKSEVLSPVLIWKVVDLAGSYLRPDSTCASWTNALYLGALKSGTLNVEGVGQGTLLLKQLRSSRGELSFPTAASML